MKHHIITTMQNDSEKSDEREESLCGGMMCGCPKDLSTLHNAI
jgi:hypothetical protein